MRRSRRRATAWGAGLLALAMAGGTPVASAEPAAAATDPETVLSTDFEDGTYDPWTQNGDPTLSVVDVDGDSALLVAGRANDYDGIKTPGGLLQPGVEYTFSMDVRLAEGTAGTPGVRFVVEPAYTWVGNTTMSADEWTTVTGTYTVPADADPATQRVYIGTGALDGAYDYLVDDITITAPPTTAPPTDPPAQTVVSTDFEDGTYDPWSQNGDPTLSVVDMDGDSVLLVAGRANDYDGIKSPGGLLQPGEEYTFSMQARLAEGTPDTQLRFVVEPAYTWVGNTTVTAGAWTTVTGTYTVPADADPATQRVYIGTAPIEGLAAYDYLLDDIVITGATGGEEPWQPTPDPDFVPGGAVEPVATPLAAARGAGDVAALTFDDGPNPGETERLLDFLAANDIEAVFCVIGQNIQAEGGAAILNRIVDEGHTLCNHTTGYADMGDWTHAQVEADLKATLEIIREALGDPQAQVPYFRAPNGSWGVTGEVAAALGMQPLGLGNVIFDWDGNDLSEETLTANLREAMQPGAVVLVHDGGGDRSNSIAAVETVVAERLAEGWTFTLPVGGLPSGADLALSFDFETDLQGWVARESQGNPTVAVTTEEAHGGAQAALVSNRAGQGDGIGYDLSGVVEPGVTYQVTASIKMAAGEEPDDIWLSVQRTSNGAQGFDTVAQFADVSSTQWRDVTASYTVPAGTTQTFLYFETSYTSGGPGDFLIDDVTISSLEEPEIQDLTPIQDTVPFPIGAAIDSRETSGAAAELLLRHFDQVTPENHMKPEAWYDAPWSFRVHPDATAIMDLAQAEDLGVYGHVLVWHSQTPAWFFQDEAGNPLTDSEADQELMRERMRTHIFAIAEALSDEYGLFGSDTNPLVAWDVVNEVVSDSGEFEDGLRRSEWYRILGEEFIDLAFRYADEAFNDVYAAEGADRPVTLFINDYNTEQDGKQQRYHDLVQRLVARDVPIDGVGHQFHVNLSMPVSALEAAIQRFQDLGLVQVVTELDVTVGTPVTEANIVEQGYYYRDAFRVFREYAEDLYSVTVWGLTDNRSWRSAQLPLLFDADLQAKPAYHGVVDGNVPPRRLAEFVFRGSVPLDQDATSALEWSQLPLHQVGDVAAFQLRWEPDHLTVYADVADATDGATDGLEIVVGDQTYTVGRDGAGDLEAVVTETTDGWAVVVHVPLSGATQGSRVPFDLRVTDGDTTVGWNEPGATGTLTLVEPLSYVEVVEAPAVPEIDGELDAAWSAANTVVTDTQVQGQGGATAEVRTLWRDNTLYVLAEVADPVLDASGSDPWTQDSFEIFLDVGNYRAGPYRYDDTQIRISFDNAVSFGTGDEAFQAARVGSATSVVEGGYVVEAAISLLEEGGLGTFHGLDFQVNDAEGGERTAIRTWADPTQLGYQSTERWGVAQLVGPVAEPEPDRAFGVYLYRLLNPNAWPSWGNSGEQTLVAVRDGWPERVTDAVDLQEVVDSRGICGPGLWAIQADWINGTPETFPQTLNPPFRGIGIPREDLVRFQHIQLDRLASVPECEEPVLDPALSLSGTVLAAGATVEVDVTGFAPGSTVEMLLESRRGSSPHNTSVPLGEVTVGTDGSGTVTLRIPAATAAGPQSVVARSGDHQVEERLTVTRAAAGQPRLR